MGIGGFDVVSLALFTAFAPAGAVAFALLALFLLGARGASPELRVRVMRLLAVPLCAVWAGFIASATHLGTPANALYVVAGIGRSPLSNEVAAVTAFLFAAGVYWLYSFKTARRVAVERALLACTVVAAAAFVAFTSRAYDVGAVLTWSTWHASAGIVLVALYAGPALAAATLALAGGIKERVGSAWAWGCLAAAAALAVACTAFMLVHLGYLQTVANNVAVAGDLVPWYPVVIAVFAVAVAGGLIFEGAGLRLLRECEKPRAQGGAGAFDERAGVRRRLRGLGCVLAGCALVFSAALVSRFPFYLSYLPAGF